jgi:hypothetical protein
MFPWYAKRSKYITKALFKFCVFNWGEDPDEKIREVNSWFSDRTNQPENPVISNFGGDKFTNL